MACTAPLYGWLSKEPNHKGNFYITFAHADAQLDESREVPCGKCNSCRLQKGQEWAIRSKYELRYHEQSSFITLTYNDEHLPYNRGLDPTAITLFIKRLRHYLSQKPDNPKIRYLACGEYGAKPDYQITGFSDRLGRPHYHLIVYGYQFEDLELHAVNFQDDKIYTSETCSQLWPYGFVTIGTATKESSGYVARYLMKKIGGELADDHYSWVSQETGEIHQRAPEFLRASLRPGIGHQWYDDFKNDLAKGQISDNGKLLNIPKYYLRLMKEEEDPVHYFRYKENQRINADPNNPDRTAERLKVKARLVEKRIQRLKRA